MYTWPNGDVYRGSYIHGLRDGFGVTKYKSGARYEGFYKNNRFNGEGEYTWPNKTVFRGDFVDGAITGFGVRESSTEWYEGWFLKGHYHGTGQLDVHGKSSYFGQWNYG